MIFFHGNSEDIGKNLKKLTEALAERFGMNVMAPEYPTYGIYKSKLSNMNMEQNINYDASSLL